MKRQDSESAWEADERRRAHCIYLTGRRGVTEAEAAAIIIGEAKQLISEELGGVGVQWGGASRAQVASPAKTPVLTSPLAGRFTT